MIVGVFAALLAAAPPLRVATVARVVADDTRGTSAAPVERAALAAARWFPELTAELPSAMSADFDDCVHACGADDACVSRCLRDADVARGLYLVVNLSGADAVVTAQLIDPARGTALTDDVQVGAPEALEALVSAAVERVLGAAGHALGGLVTVTVDPADARVLVLDEDGRAVDAGRAFALAPGPHRLRVEAVDHEPVELSCAVEARGTVALSATLARRETLVGRWWFWAALAVVAAGGVTAGVVASGALDERRLCHDPRVCP